MEPRKCFKPGDTHHVHAYIPHEVWVKARSKLLDRYVTVSEFIRNKFRKLAFEEEEKPDE